MFDVQMIRKGFRDYSGLMKGITPVFLEEAGIVVEAEAKRLINPDTGNLRGSINHRVQLNTAIVATNVEYAEPVEYGTGPHRIDSAVKIRGVGWRHIGMHPGTKAQPFMRPAIDNNRKGLIRRLANMIRSAIRG